MIKPLGSFQKPFVAIEMSPLVSVPDTPAVVDDGKNEP